jgi:hypothetical protein
VERPSSKLTLPARHDHFAEDGHTVKSPHSEGGSQAIVGIADTSQVRDVRQEIFSAQSGTRPPNLATQRLTYNQQYD